MWLLPSVVVLCVCVNYIVCPPVAPQAVEQGSEQDSQDTGLEYDRYLQEVVNTLEQDEEFKKKLEEANITEIKSGKIAMHLDKVAHHVREKLDEIKRKEVARLRDLAKQRMKAMQGIQRIDENMLHHVDVGNPHTFEMKDLERLIKKATNDLEEIDKKRREEFKQYEMEKEHERREHLKELPEEERKKEEAKFEEQQKKHKDHPKVHHPGSKDQLEEVWEKQDHLDKESFDAKSFFKLHDIDGNMLLDEEEIEALFQKELDEVYDPNAPEDDMEERYEEMSRMREHVLNEIDEDKDKLISLPEFLKYTKSQAFEKDEGWETLDNQEQYSEQELQEYERMLMEEENRRRQQGAFDSHAQPGLVMQPHHDPNVQQMEMPHQGAPAHQQGQFGQPLHPEQVQAMQAQQAQMMQQAQMHGQQQGQMHPDQAQMHAQQQAQMHAQQQQGQAHGQQQQQQMHPDHAQMHAQQQAQMHAQQQQQQMHPDQAQMHAQQQAQMHAQQQQQQMHPDQAQMHAQQQAQMHQQAQIHAQQQAQLHAQQAQQAQQAQGQPPAAAQGQPPAAQQVQGQPPVAKQEQAPVHAQGQQQAQAKETEENKPVV